MKYQTNDHNNTESKMGNTPSSKPRNKTGKRVVAQSCISVAAALQSAEHSALCSCDDSSSSSPQHSPQRPIKKIETAQKTNGEHKWHILIPTQSAYRYPDDDELNAHALLHIPQSPCR
eukprot:scaffold397_cov317-Alexandrium_tamarense.AAC.3